MAARYTLEEPDLASCQTEMEVLQQEKLSLVEQLEAKDEEIKQLQELVEFSKSNASKPSKHRLPRPVTSSLHLPLVEKKFGLYSLDIQRYSRQMILPEFRVKSQLCLSSKSVMVAGLGGLGCPVVAYLAAAGVGRLGLVDLKEVLVTDLGLVHQEEMLAELRVVSAKCWLEGLNSSVDIVPFQLDPSSLCEDLVGQFDVLVDCTENETVRLALEATCVSTGKPMVRAQAIDWQGELTVFNYNEKESEMRALELGFQNQQIDKNPEEEALGCETDVDPSSAGSVPAVQGVMGCLAALEVIKILTGLPVTLAGRRMVYDAKEGRCRTLVGRGKT